MDQIESRVIASIVAPYVRFGVDIQNESGDRIPIKAGGSFKSVTLMRGLKFKEGYKMLLRKASSITDAEAFEIVECLEGSLKHIEKSESRRVSVLYQLPVVIDNGSLKRIHPIIKDFIENCMPHNSFWEEDDPVCIYLFQKGIDIYGLIEKGYAVDAYTTRSSYTN